MTLLYILLINIFAAAAGPGSIQAGPGFIVLLFFFMARLKAFKGGCAAYPYIILIYTLQGLKKANRRRHNATRRATDDRRRPDSLRPKATRDRARVGLLCTLHNAPSNQAPRPAFYGAIKHCYT